MEDGQKELEILLKQNGFKVTAQRTAVLEVLAGRPDVHMTAEEIYDCVREGHPEIGLATVYRALQLFSELGIADRLNLDDGCVRYEIGGKGTDNGAHRHHHLVCMGCGRVFTFKDDLLENLETKIREKLAFEVVNHEVKLFGYCKSCKETEKRD